MGKWEPKPHVVGFVASMVMIASVSTLVEEQVRAAEPGVTVDDVTLADGLDDPTVEPTTTPTATPTAGATTGPQVVGPSQAPSTTGGDASGIDDQPGQDGGPGGGGPSGSTPEPTSRPTDDPRPGWPDATLYTGAAATRGITDDELVLCGHAALALGAAFDTSREDLNVYWDVVNDAGGVLGREVTMTWEDDAYVASTAVTAATTCADKDPFMILGGIGFDQIPSVRDWAESNEELYLHHIAVAPTQTYDYSFSLSPTVELVGRESGNYIVREHRAEKVGVIYRGTDNWTPGSDAGIAVMEAAKMDVTPYEIVQNQGVYAQELNAMKLSNTEVVWVWENALNAAQIINQASEIEYYPTWVVFPFQTTIDILTEPTKHTIEGVASWGSYARGGYGNAFAEHGLAAEIKAFEAAYAKYRPETVPNDILWQVWVGNKILHRMFEDCGNGCDRNRFAGMMLDGYRTTVQPGCQIDFGDSRSFGGHHGGFRFFTQELFQPRSGPAYRTNEYCVATLK